MKRVNPKTGSLFKYGDIREDGMIFRTYMSKVKLDGFHKEVWLSKDVFVKFHQQQKQAAIRWRKSRLAKRLAVVDKIKIDSGCCECGYNKHPSALDFDHIDPSKKLFDISKKIVFSKLSALMEEIKKCRVLCANCHRIHSYESGHSENKTPANYSNRIEKILGNWDSESAA